MFLGDAEFYRTKGAKDKKKRKQKGSKLATTAKIGASGITGATGLAGGTWTLGEGLKVLKKTRPTGLKILRKAVPIAAVTGLAGGVGIEAIRQALKKQRESKRRKNAK